MFELLLLQRVQQGVQGSKSLLMGIWEEKVVPLKPLVLLMKVVRLKKKEEFAHCLARKTCLNNAIFGC